MQVGPALVLGLIIIIGVTAGLTYVVAGGTTKTTTQIVTSTVTIATTVQTPTTVVGVVNPQQQPTYYIILTGVVGQSSVLNYTGAIQLRAWDWGPPKTSCGPAGAPCGQTETSLDFNATTSKASATIQKDASQGTLIPRGTLIGVANIGGQDTVVVKYDFTNLLVASYSTNASLNLPVDMVTLVFQRVSVVV